MPQDLASVVTTLIARFRGAIEGDDARTMADQVQLAEIPSPTAREQRRGAWMAAALAQLGYRTHRDEVGNVVATDPIESDVPPVVVCAHLDTVFPDDISHRVETRGGRYIGPGIGDNARGLAGMLTIARVLRQSGVRTRHPIIFAATVGEEGEGDLRGARCLFARHGANAHAAFALDGAGDERIVTHAVGTRRFRITISGPGGHSWAASQTPNPLHAAADLTSELARLPLRNTPRTTIAVTRMQGGDAVNAIPATAVLDVEFRSPQGAVLQEGERTLARLLSAALERESPGRSLAGGLSAITAITSDRPSGAVTEDATPVRAAIAATRAIDRIPEFAIASTDANIPLSLGIPAVALGAGGTGGDTHTTGEWFENRAGALGLTRALAAIVATAGLA
jgi:acetylornithine deacetylase/succinyl-diaminopimelate desuccinylase-like protein